jgi:hypothetical protein
MRRDIDVVNKIDGKGVKSEGLIKRSRVRVRKEKENIQFSTSYIF